MKQLGKMSLWMMIAIFSTLLISCEDESEDKKLSAEEAKLVLSNLNATMQSDFNAIKEAEGIAAIDELSNMQDPFSSGKSNQKGVRFFSNLKESILPASVKNDVKSENEEPFDFLANVGTYSWNIQYQMWDVSHGEPADKIVINFTTDELQTENNATLTIRDYVEQAFSDFGGIYYEPTSMDIDLYINFHYAICHKE